MKYLNIKNFNFNYNLKFKIINSVKMKRKMARNNFEENIFRTILIFRKKKEIFLKMFSSIDKVILSSLSSELKGVMNEESLNEDKWTVNKMAGI